MVGLSGLLREQTMHVSVVLSVAFPRTYKLNLAISRTHIKPSYTSKFVLCFVDVDMRYLLINVEREQTRPKN